MTFNAFYKFICHGIAHTPSVITIENYVSFHTSRTEWFLGTYDNRSKFCYETIYDERGKRIEGSEATLQSVE